ncbi:kinetochore protein NUF2 homolog isoform X2 [Malania oleifera]|uniref:kinetochore protein NUF2 homolog isoform X2 n=1 Tax=Malania oleifera TaxID=397392 RepID=UPI0025AE7328|nr:kinetochore protein NUF2 homolog isoform X2 [Malania oleifera]
MSTFQYPELSPADIVAILADSQIATISPNNLNNPNADFVSALYSSILHYLDSLQEDHGQVDFAALEQFENPDLHVDSVRTMNLCNKIREVVAAVHCPVNFTLKDLLRPDPKRTKLFLSAILNFCIHKDTRMNLLRPVVEELSLLDEQRKELEARISQLNGEIADLNEAREKETPLVQEVEAKVKELRQIIPGLNNQQMSLRASIRKMKEKAQEMDEKIASAEFALVQSVQENANLRSKIVQSPDKLQRALEEKKSILVEAKNSERSAMQSFQEKAALVEVYTKAFKKMSKHFSQMQAIQEQVNSAKTIDKDVKALKAKLSDEEMLNKSLDAKLIELQGKAEQLNESRKQSEKDRDLKCEQASKDLDSMKLEAELRQHDLEARQRKVEAVLVEVDGITSKINSVKESGDGKKQELVRKGEEIVKEFFQYSDSIGALLLKIEAAPKADSPERLKSPAINQHGAE